MGNEEQTRWLPGLAALASIATCYGTLLVVAALGAAGIGIAIDNGLWAGAIVGFALLAVAGLALGRRRHGRILPLLIGAAGAGALAFAMYVDYHVLIELGGFALLAIAAFLDWRTR